MKSQHTPSPWLVRFDEDSFDSKLSVLEVIDGSDASLNHPQGELVLARVNVSAFAPHMDEPLANARLIATAPDLLAALEFVSGALSQPVFRNGSSDSASASIMREDAKVILNHIGEIIAKAKGV